MTALPLIVIRPEPGNAATLGLAHEMRLHAHGFPLFEIASREWELPNGRFAAILAGSANVFRYGGPRLETLRHVPVAAVGETTATVARAAGFTVALVGEGGLQPMVAALPPGNYLRLAGQDRVELTAPHDVRITTRVIYAARPCQVTPAQAALLAQPCVVLLHSGEAARHFACECERLEIPRAGIHIACLADRIRDLAGSGWASAATARTRTDADLLELAARMCQTV